MRAAFKTMAGGQHSAPAWELLVPRENRYVWKTINRVWLKMSGHWFIINFYIGMTHFKQTRVLSYCVICFLVNELLESGTVASLLSFLPGRGIMHDS